MTKERLAAYRSNRQEIRELEYTLNNRWRSEAMIGNDVIMDYNKGYPMPQTVVGFDQERYERLQDRDCSRKALLEGECRAVDDFIAEIQDSVTRRIFQLYFTEGEVKPTQAQIAGKIYLERSRISRRIDEYLKNAHNAQKAHV